MAIKYKALVEDLRNVIDDYIEKGINKMPSEQEIGQNYQVSRQTVRQAFAQLKEEGLIESRRGSGTYITGRKSHAGGNTIAVLLTNRTDYIYPKLLNNIRLSLAEAGFTEQVHITENRTAEERRILKELLDNPPRGMIVEGCRSALPNPNLDLYRKLKDRDVAMIFLFNYYRDFLEVPCIKGDNAGGSHLLTRHLIALGYQKIGGIFKFDDLQGIERFQGYAETITGNHLELPDEFTVWIDSEDMNTIRNGELPSIIETFLTRNALNLDALICYNDEIAYLVLSFLSAHGIKVPDELAIAAFDNSYYSSSGSIPITTLSHENQKMGTLAAEAVIRLAKGLPVSSKEIPWELTARKSTMDSKDS